VGEPELETPEAVLETGLGTVDLGVRAQIAEIERGFFDLLEVRRDAAAGKQG
jgi:flagellar assembly protein FliH